MKTEFRRQPGRGRHLPGADLARLHDSGATRSSTQRAADASARKQGRRAERTRRRRTDDHGRRPPAGAEPAARRRPARRRRRAASPADGDGATTPHADAARRRQPQPAPTPRRRRRHRPRRATGRGGASGGAGGTGGAGARRRRAGLAPRRGSAARRPRRPRPRDAAAARRAEAPRQLGGLVMPMRVPTAIARPAPAARARLDADRAVGSEVVALRSRPMPSACVSLPGPEQRSSTRATPAARAHDARCPSSGSSARISTAAPTPSGSQTALSSAWMP